METKTTFGFDQLTMPSPLWAKLTFRIIVILTTVATFIIGNTGLINEAAKVETMVWVKATDMLALLLSQMFGETPVSPHLRNVNKSQ